MNSAWAPFRHPMFASSGGYGLLLGWQLCRCGGREQVFARLRKHFTPAALLCRPGHHRGRHTALLGFVHLTAAAALALACGAAWILALSTLNSLYQLTLPQWVKTRGMSFYLVVFQGGTAVGSVICN